MKTAGGSHCYEIRDARRKMSGFAEEIFRQSNKDVKVNRVNTVEYGISIAKRPFNSRLDKKKLIDNGFKPLPDWKDALKRYLKEIM